MGNRLPDQTNRPYQFQTNGKWLPDVTPLHVGAANYVTQQNLRPTPTGVETVEGYSKINTTLINTPVNAHHFSKPGESHVIAKTNNGGTYELYENTTAIPSAGDFDATALYTVASGAGSFSNGPKGTMFYADGTHNLVWGGDEIDPLGFFVGDDTDAIIDYTSEITNSLTDQVAYVGAQGIDAYTVLMLHMDGSDGSTTFTDDGSTGHSPSANGDAQIDTALYKFNNASCLLDGTGDYVSVADHDNWFFDTGDFTIDAWVRFTDLGDNNNSHEIYSQYVDTNNYISFSVFSNVSNSQQLKFTVASAGVVTISVSSTPTVGLLQNDTWYHVAIVRNGNDFDAYLNGASIASGTDSDSAPNLAAPLRIGERNGSYFKGSIDELRVSKGIARWTSSFTPKKSAYRDGLAFFYIASPYKLDGVKLYIQEANTEASTLSAGVWGGSSFGSLTVTDSTASGGVSLAQDGTVIWPYSEDPKPLYVNGQALYVYRFSLSAGGAGIYKATASAPLQPIRDIWNGSPRTCISFQVFDSPAYQDDTFLVQAKDSTEASPYASNIGGLSNGNDDALIAVFDDRAMAISFGMLSSKVNAAANTIADIEYWNGSAYTSVGYFKDGTLDSGGTKSFSQSGVVSWTPPGESQEFTQDIYGVSGYAYRITFATATGLTADTQIDHLTGVTAPLEISGYDLVAEYGSRVLLIKGNKIEYSQTKYPWIFNGVDSSFIGVTPSGDGFSGLEFGDDDSIVQTAKLFNRYGSNLISGVVLFKKNSVGLLVGSQPYSDIADQLVVKSISGNIGCAAPLAVDSYQLEASEGLNFMVVLFMDYSGPYIYTGAEPSRIVGVENFFDKSQTDSINHDHIDKSWSYIDSANSQWNLCFPVGASTTPNKWIVYDFQSKRWFEKVPAAYPTVTAPVTSSTGAGYNYGIISTGQMLRLDNTQAWDGSAIDQVLTTGIFSPPMVDDYGFWSRSAVNSIRVMCEPIDENRDLTVSIYNDGVLSSNSVTVELDSSGVVAENYTSKGNLNEDAKYYQVKFSASTSVDKLRMLAWGYRARLLMEL